MFDNMLVKLYGLIRNSLIRKAIIKLIIQKTKGEFFSIPLREIAFRYHNISIGMGTYGACFDFTKVHYNVILGNYCSIAKNVYIYTRTHPLDSVSTHPYFYNKTLGGVKEDRLIFNSCHIGHNVWLRQNGVILPSCKKIGNGAVIGANAVVTKDIPDFAIVAGVPARILRYRFSNEDIAIINKSRWWEWAAKEIADNSNSFNSIDNFKKLLREISIKK